MRDERAPGAATAPVLGDEEVLQIDIVADRPARAMADVVDEPDGEAVVPRERAAHRLGGIEQPRPGHHARRLRDVGLVEGLIAAPQRHPSGVVGGCEGADRDGQFQHSQYRSLGMNAKTSASFTVDEAQLVGELCHFRNAARTIAKSRGGR